MQDKRNCPFCGSTNCESKATADFYTGYKCSSFDNPTWVYISDWILEEYMENRGKCLDLIYEKLLRKPYCYADDLKYKWHFYYNDKESLEEYEKSKPSYINLAFEIAKYPTTHQEKLDRILLNLSVLNPDFDRGLTVDQNQSRAYFANNKKPENYNILAVLYHLEEMGYVSKTPSYHITVKGWQRIDKLTSTKNEERQGFIAMSFNKDTKTIRECFRRAIEESGYAVRVIDEKEHNNQIVPEIFYEIEKSKFMVVDVTYPNNGAYYEAGYAQALGKQVIICCRSIEFDDKDKRPHFDISQKSMIVWKDEEDLVNRLKKRINATVK